MKELVCSICNEEMGSETAWVSGRSDSCIVIQPCCHTEDHSETIDELKEEFPDLLEEVHCHFKYVLDLYPSTTQKELDRPECDSQEVNLYIDELLSQLHSAENDRDYFLKEVKKDQESLFAELSEIDQLITEL